MALQLPQLLFSQSSFPVVCNPKQNLPQTWSSSKQRCLRRSHVIKNNVSEAADSRLTVYQPSIWSHDFIESLDTSLPMNCKMKMMELEKKVMGLLYFDYENGISSRLEMLEVIDDIERLGLGYRFQNDIKKALNKISSITEEEISVGIFEEKEEDSSTTLHAESLRFRLLRQHGYHVSQDFIRNFKDVRGGFTGYLATDIKGLLSLYEASHLAFEEERDLHEAKLFASQHLMKNINDQENEAVNHALELPLYRRMLRLEARWFIDTYAKRKDANLLLLELAILDFNMAQSVLKRELQQVLRWWRNIGVASKLWFVRDTPTECFFLSVGMVFEPQYHCCRVGLTKVYMLITAIDDIYDVYGSLDELSIFTEAVRRWDNNGVKHMPEYLQLGFQALYNTINEIAQGESIIPILVKVWGELLEAFLVEAKWMHSKSMPTLNDYLDNAWRSVSGMVILTHGYFLIDQEIKKSSIESLEKYHDLLKWSSMIFRLCNDLGTSSDEIERGKAANAITCYMHDNGVCEEVSRRHIKALIDEAWEKLIEARVACSQEMPDSFIDMAINLARISHCIYQYGDGHGAPDARAKDRVSSVIIEPITTSENEKNVKT